MSNEKETMEQYMEEIDQNMVNLKKGDVITGTVISVTDEEVIVNVGQPSDGVISKSELSHDDVDPKELFNEGDEIKVLVLKADDGEGNIVLSKKRAEQAVAWEELEAAFESKENFKIKLAEAVKGGMIAFHKGIRIFIPASLVSVDYIEDFTPFVGNEVDVKIIEFDRRDNKVIASRKAVEKVEREAGRKEFLDSLEKGMILEGKVARLANFGAFVDLGYLDGLVHISEMSWKRLKHPSEAVKVGETVKVEVLSFDKDSEKVSLRLADIPASPWSTVDQDYSVNQVVPGEVVRLTDFGAFVALKTGIEGLVHVSEISYDHVNHPKDVLKPGMKVDVRILNIDKKNERISLSIKEAQEGPGYEDTSSHQEGDASVTLGDLFGDKLKDLK